jgi:hypothetical protein
VRKTVQAQSFDWPQVLVPAGEKKRELWEEVMGTGSNLEL